MFNKTVLVTCIFGVALLAVGCGAKAPAVANAPTSVPKNAQNAAGVVNPANKNLYTGIANLKRFKTMAIQYPKDANIQLNAGISAYANQDYKQAKAYYEAALAINPNSGIAYNNLGNIYFRAQKNAKQGLPYYIKATQVQPDYDYGWLNLADCQIKLGDNSAAKATIAKALQILPASDMLYPTFTQLQAKLK